MSAQQLPPVAEYDAADECRLYSVVICDRPPAPLWPQSDGMIRYLMVDDECDMLWRWIRFVTFGGDVGKWYVGWDMPDTVDKMRRFFVDWLGGGPNGSGHPRFEASQIGRLLGHDAVLHQLMQSRRMIFTPKFDGAPFGPLVAKLLTRADGVRKRRALALCVQTFGVRNMAPCNCCEARYEIHANREGDARARVMYPFFDCVSLNVDVPGSAGSVWAFADGCCANCIFQDTAEWCIYNQNQPAHVRAFADRHRTSTKFHDGPRGLFRPDTRRRVLEPSRLHVQALTNVRVWDWSNEQHRLRAESPADWPFGDPRRKKAPWSDKRPNRE